MATQTKSEIPVKVTPAAEKAPAHVVSPLDDIDRLFDQLWPRNWLQRWERPHFAELATPEARMPRLDVIDRDDEVVIKAEVPGVKKEDIQISLSGNRMTIKGESRHEERAEKGDYYRCEISRGAFSRSIVLPADVDDTKAKAEMKDGLLQITLPKVAAARKRDIKIQ